MPENREAEGSQVEIDNYRLSLFSLFHNQEPNEWKNKHNTNIFIANEMHFIPLRIVLQVSQEVSQFSVCSNERNVQ